MEVFEDYSAYYDILYEDKKYKDEAEYIKCLLKNNIPNAKHILDLGCGTGMHANLLSQQNYIVEGADISSKMLAEAERKFPSLNFYNQDARDLNLGKKYDAVISLFDVASYQTTNEDIMKYFSSIQKHLNDRGLFIFNFWYGPSVLKQKPEARIKRIERENIKITRIAEPVSYPDNNIIDVNYEIIVEDIVNKILEKIYETHKMRYYFMPEIQFLLDLSGMTVLETYGWMKFEKPDMKDWSVCVVARRK